MSTNKLPSPDDRFKSNLITLLDIINDMFEEGMEHKIVSNNLNVFPLVKFFIKKTPGEYMIKRFIKRTHPHWEKIRDRDLDYFREIGLQLFNTIQDKGLETFKGEEELSSNNKLVSSLSTDHFKDFKKLLEASYQYEGETIDVFDKERENDVWMIMESFVKISLCYIHECRKEVEGKYTVEYFPQIPVKEKARDWGVKSI